SSTLAPSSSDAMLRPALDILCRSESRSAHRKIGAVFLTAGRSGFSEKNRCYSLLRSGYRTFRRDDREICDCRRAHRQRPVDHHSKTQGVAEMQPTLDAIKEL